MAASFERFELGRFLGKTLLYGADVPENFLNQRGASVIKTLTGYDPVTLEFKRSNESPLVICAFNALVTCNSRLTVHLEGDTEATRTKVSCHASGIGKAYRQLLAVDHAVVGVVFQAPLSVIEDVETLTGDDQQ